MKYLSSFLVLASIAVTVRGGIFGESRVGSIGSVDYGVNSILLDLITPTVPRPQVQYRHTQLSPVDAVIVAGLSGSGPWNSGTRGYQYRSTESQALGPDLAVIIAALYAEDQSRQGHQVNHLTHDVKTVRKSQVTEGIKTTQAIFPGKASSGGSAGYQYGGSTSSGGSSSFQSGGSDGYRYGVKKH